MEEIISNATMKAIVHRKRGPAWEFEWTGTRFRHITRSGTVYEIMVSQDVYLDVWLGRVAGDVMFTAEADIRATHITFPDGGVYVFPGQEDSQ